MKVRRFFLRIGRNRKTLKENEKRGSSIPSSWMMPISHGYHVLEDRRSSGEDDDVDDKQLVMMMKTDLVVVQREQIADNELWFFGVFDARIGDGITSYIQSNFFNKQPKQMKRKSKEMIKKALQRGSAKLREMTEDEDNEELSRLGSASAIVINGEKLVVGNMGSYSAVVCRDGRAHCMKSTTRHYQASKRHWCRNFIPGAIRMPRVRRLGCDSSNTVGMKWSKNSEPLVGSETIQAATEFVILASTGIWEVMKHQEAVSLIMHIYDPQEAAECLAREALTRMSRSRISCVVIRFD